jgi:hypothetical protein
MFIRPYSTYFSCVTAQETKRAKKKNKEPHKNKDNFTFRYEIQPAKFLPM